MKMKIIANAKFMLKVLGLIPKNLLENVEKQENAPKFLDIQKIKGVPCMYIRYNEETLKNEWLCLEIPSPPKMSWKYGRKWCKSKGGDYGSISTLKFISERRLEIKQVLESKGYPFVEYGWHWSTKYDSSRSWELSMYSGNYVNNLKHTPDYVLCIVSK